MDSPQRPGGNGDDGPGRPPRKLLNADQDDGDTDEARAPGVIDAFGDATDLPAWIFLFLAAVLAEHFRSYYVCGC